MSPPAPDKDPGKPGRSGGITAMLREVRHSLRRIEQGLSERPLAPPKTLGVVALLIGQLAVLHAALVQWNVFGLARHAPAPSFALPLGALCIGCGLYLLLGIGRDGARIRFILLALVAAIQLAATGLGGVTGMAYLPAAIAAVHLLALPVPALRISAALLSSCTLIAALSLTAARAPEISGQVAAGLATAVILQAMARRQQRKTAAALQEMRALGRQIGHLENETINSLDEREIAEITDKLTGLLNAAGFESVANAVTARADERERYHLMLIRLQKLEDYLAVMTANERVLVLGHIVGRLKDLAGAGSVLARTGKDEFAVLLPAEGLSDGEMGASIGLIHDSLKRPLAGASKFAAPIPAIGTGVWPDDSRDIGQLLDMARIALLRAVDNRSGGFMRYDQGMQSEAEERISVIEDLELAIERGEFELHYQPIIDLGSGLAHKVEALIRWHHPVRGMIPPVKFIPAAEASGQIIAMTDWVIEAALAQLREWRRSLDPDIEISVNIPSAYLEHCIENRDEMLERIIRWKIPPRGLTFEITEGSFLSMGPEMQRFMAHLESIGIQIAMDDFGVGYSNLSQLERLPLNFLKIDKSFVDDIEMSPQKLAICRAIIKVGHELGLRIVAEGIENPGQQALLSQAKCDYGQGYLFSKPLKAGDLAVLFTLKAERPAPRLNLV